MAVSIARDLDLLDKSIASLKLDYERFFSGDLKVPPLPARKSVERVLNRIGNVSLDRAEDRFRLQVLQSRFTALSELWEKRLLAREEGRSRVRPPVRVRSIEEPAASPARDAGAAASVKGSGRGDLRSLFDRYCAARAAVGEDISRLRYDRFEELVRKQAAEIRRETGATRLAFEVQTREGKVRLVGRSLQASTKGTP
ncbi:MAG: MXAN_5187 C-terminal domain-containing protein [Thermoanaerobaculia bacterium]